MEKWSIDQGNLMSVTARKRRLGLYLRSKDRIKEVEMVESVDDLKSSCSARGFQMPNFEVLDAKIASALNRIIHNSHFKRRISLEEQKAQKEDRFLRRKTDRSPDLRELPGHWSQRFCR